MMLQTSEVPVQCPGECVCVTKCSAFRRKAADEPDSAHWVKRREGQIRHDCKDSSRGKTRAGDP